MAQRGTAAVYSLTTTSRHANTTLSSQPIHRKLNQKSSSKQHVSRELTRWKNLTKTMPLESQMDRERRHRRVQKVGVKLTAVLLFTFRKPAMSGSNIVRPYLDALYVPPVDVLDIGGPLNSVLIDEISKMKGSSYCVNQQTGCDLHRMAYAKKASQLATEYRPRVAWIRVPCCYWDGHCY